MSRVLQYLKFTASGVLCAIIWVLMDRYIFMETNTTSYYVAVMFSYIAGASGFAPRTNS